MAERAFIMVSPYQPAGDQPAAIEKLSEAIERGEHSQILLGVTGSGKTFTMAGVVQQVQRPTLVIAPNKILAAQLFAEFKELFPDNAVEYFVSYYDYYQPEAYIPQSDTYIEKRFLHQRRHRQDAPLRHPVSADQARRAHRRLGFLHLRAGFTGRVSQHASFFTAR